MVLESNGFSYVSFDQRVLAYEIIENTTKRFVFFLSKFLTTDLIKRQEIGTWSSGVPYGKMNFKPDMEQKLVPYHPRTVLKVVYVIKPPFFFWNETSGH